MGLRALGAVVADLSGINAALKAAQDKADRAMTKANAAESAAANASQAAASAAQTGSAAHQIAVDADTKAVTLEQVATTLGAAIPASEAKHAEMDRATAALKARLDAQGFATGEGAVPAIALAASVDVTVPLSRPMPSETYKVDVLRSAALIGRITTTIKSQTKTQVVVNVKAGLLVSAGSSITVVATA